MAVPFRYVGVPRLKILLTSSRALSVESIDSHPGSFRDRGWVYQRPIGGGPFYVAAMIMEIYTLRAYNAKVLTFDLTFSEGDALILLRNSTTIESQFERAWTFFNPKPIAGVQFNSTHSSFTGCKFQVCS